MAVENDQDAVRTLKENNPGIKVYDGCIKKFIQDYHILKCSLGENDHVSIRNVYTCIVLPNTRLTSHTCLFITLYKLQLHFSSPCQEFSTANRSQMTGNRERADLSLLLIDLVRMTSIKTAVFENVVGLWRRKNVHYLKNIVKELMALGYQVRCTVLHACDYGDAQKRPRFFMYIAKNSVPMPSFPAKSHGDAIDLWPYFTVKDALSTVKNHNSLPNMEGRSQSLKVRTNNQCQDCIESNPVSI